MSRYIDADALVKNCDCVEALLGIELTTVRDFIKNAPTADVVEVVRGEWIGEWNEFFHLEIPTCSICKHGVAFETNYCPNCGAKMDERREDGKIH